MFMFMGMMSSIGWLSRFILAYSACAVAFKVIDKASKDETATVINFVTSECKGHANPRLTSCCIVSI